MFHVIRQLSTDLANADCWVHPANTSLTRLRPVELLFTLPKLAANACQLVCDDMQQLNITRPLLSLLSPDFLYAGGSDCLATSIAVGSVAAFFCFGFALSLLYQVCGTIGNACKRKTTAEATVVDGIPLPSEANETRPFLAQDTGMRSTRAPNPMANIPVGIPV